MSKRIRIEESEFLVEFTGDRRDSGKLNGDDFEWDVAELGNGIYHILKDSKSYNVEVLPEMDGKKGLKVNGTIYQSEAIGQFDELLKKLGMEKGAGSKVNELKAPMPGLVLSIDVAAGDQLKKGDRVLVLEAMKMENVIKAPADAVVASVEVEKGKTVEKNQVMVRFT